jgi:hypothetical protein
MTWGSLVPSGSLFLDGFLYDSGSLLRFGVAYLRWLARYHWGNSEALARSGDLGFSSHCGSLPRIGFLLSPGSLE